MVKSVLQLAVILSILLSGKPLVYAQGTFINLNFEQAQITITPEPFSHAAIRSTALPGWTTYNHYVGSETILYNSITISASAVSIHDSASTFGSPMQGQYRVGLAADNLFGLTAAAIGQVGTIPINARSVRWYQATGSPVVSFAGQVLPIVHLSTEANYSVYGANLTGLAGTTGELRFGSQLPAGFVWLDNISFSTQAVPEPSSYALIALGLALAFSLRRPRG